MAQACDASRISQHAPSPAATVASTKVGAYSLDDRTCAPVENTAAPPLQSCAPRRVHTISLQKPKNFRIKSQVLIVLLPRNKIMFRSKLRVNSRRTPSQQLPQLRAADKYAKNSGKHCAVLRSNCCKFNHVTSACTADVSSARKYIGCGGVGHTARYYLIALRSTPFKRILHFQLMQSPRPVTAPRKSSQSA